jgi:hypothetical protein
MKKVSTIVAKVRAVFLGAEMSALINRRLARTSARGTWATRPTRSISSSGP